MWKLFTRDSRVSPPVEGFSAYKSEEAALHAACSQRKVAHVAILRIEGPNGEKIGGQAIIEWCDAQTKTP